MSVKSTMKEIKPAFWLSNAQEACERLAYFGIRAVLPLMMVSVGTGGLGLSMGQKGVIYGIWAFIQCLVPMVSGGYSESFGYKKSLIVAFIINTLGYLLMANVLNVATLLTGSAILDPTINFWIMLLAGCTIGLGTAIFKPPVQGIVAKSLTKKSSGFGFGLFYWVVNIGGFLAPMLATWLRGNDQAPTWHYVFYGAAFVTLFNLVITLLFFREPKRTAKELKKAKETSASDVFFKTLGTLWNDKSMMFFLLIVSGFWLMFMQLWDLLPNFLEEWVDRRAVGEFLLQIPLISGLDWYESNGALKPEMVINIDSFAIILFVLPLSALFSKFKMMTALITGMVISVIGFVLGGLTMSGGIACLAIFIFAIGEIICSPKFSEYIGMTAPKDKKAIYMGFSNIPFAIGWAAGNFLSGPLYGFFSSKLEIGHKWLANHGITNVPADKLDITNAQQFLMDKMGMKKEELPELIKNSGKDLAELKQMLADRGLALSDNCQKNYDEALSKFEGSNLEEFTKELGDKLNSCQLKEAQNAIDLQNLMDIVKSKGVTEVPVDYCNIECVVDKVQEIEKVPDSFAATEVLWNSASPWLVWVVLGFIGILSMVGMIAFYFKSDMSKMDEAKESEDDEESDEDSEEESDEDSEEKSEEDSEEKSEEKEAEKLAEKKLEEEEKTE